MRRKIADGNRRKSLVKRDLEVGTSDKATRIVHHANREPGEKMPIACGSENRSNFEFIAK
jgi:hypothetical protein